MSHYHRHFSPADQKMNEDFEISFLLTRGKADDKSLLRVVGVSDKDRRTVVPRIARDRSCGRVTGKGVGRVRDVSLAVKMKVWGRQEGK